MNENIVYTFKILAKAGTGKYEWSNLITLTVNNIKCDSSNINQVTLSTFADSQ